MSIQCFIIQRFPVNRHICIHSFGLAPVFHLVPMVDKGWSGKILKIHKYGSLGSLILRDSLYIIEDFVPELCDYRTVPDAVH